MKMVHEVRRQFREIKGLMEGEAEPETEKCVDIATRGALQEMILPGLLAVAVPVAVFSFSAGRPSEVFWPVYSHRSSAGHLMSNSGGAGITRRST